MMINREMKCRVCGCTDSQACHHPDLGNCWWVEEDFCSHCAMIGTGEIKKEDVTHLCSDTKSVNVISVELARIDVKNYRTSEWVLDDSTQPIQYGAHGEYMIWLLLYRTYWFAVDIGKGDGHDFYAFDVRKIANDANMPILMEDIDLYYKREWLTRFLQDLAEKEYFLDFRHNDADRHSSNQI